MVEQERLYINDKLIELGTETTQFARTLQVNDLVSLDNRQTNFTKNIKIPKTPKNVLNMDYLGVLGNRSNLPYQKNTVKYFIGNEAIIYNGWGVITETNKFYNLTIYDGNLDLYKSIENTTLGDLNLSALTHSKNLTTVVDSFSSTTLPYKYILADYNGQSTYIASGVTSGSTINIDYLVPSVKVSYLWDKIFQKYGYTYDGTIFSNDDFTNLWMTYPKAIDIIGTTSNIYINDNTRFQSFASTYDGINSLYFYVDGTASVFNLNSVINDKHFMVNETGSYKIDISGEIIPVGNDGSLAGVKCDIWLCKNSQSISNANDVTPIALLKADIGGDYSTYYIADSNTLVGLNAGDTFSIIIRRNDGKNLRYVQEKSANKLKINVVKVDGGAVDFSATLIEFSTKDFLNEINQRFGLSLFKNKYTNNYSFKTLDEITNSTNPIDWSDKFQSIESERYIYGNYAQKNVFKYKYNDANASFNDGFINIDNKNLSDSKTIIQSKIYSPESNFSNELGFQTNVYKLWNKEINDKKDIKYKSLENRFHLLRTTPKTFATTTRIGSYTLQSIQTITAAPVETFTRLPFQDIVSNYYPSISKVLNKSKIIIAVINLRYTDITDFDFTRLYFIKQLGNYYLVNKIVNFQIGKPTKVELIKVDYATVYIPDATTVLAEPTNLTKSNVTSSGVTLNWSASSGATAYNVYKDSALYANLGNVLTYNVIGLAPSTSYNFTVKARDAQGNLSTDSNIVSFTTIGTGDVTPPTAPILSRTINQDNEVIQLSWSVSTDNVGVTFYDVYTSLDNVYFENLIIRTSANNYDDYPEYDTTTYYRVMALDAAGNYSSWSNTVSGTIAPPVVCFVEGTLITLSDGTQLPIEALEVNQLLLSTEIETLTDTNNVDELYNWSNTDLVETRTTAPITKIAKQTANKTIVINEGLLEATPEHSQLIKRNDVWKFIQIGMVELGDYLYTINGEEIEITSVEINTEARNIYPMSLAPTHTYFANGILTHNIKQQ